MSRYGKAGNRSVSSSGETIFLSILPRILHNHSSSVPSSCIHFRYLELHNGDVRKTISSVQADTEWELGSNRSLNECKSPFEPASTSLYQFNNEQVNIKLRLIDSGTDQNFPRSNGMRSENFVSMNNASKLYELKSTKDAADRWEELSHPGSYKSVIDNSQPVPRFDFETVVNKQREAKHVATLENYHKVS